VLEPLVALQEEMKVEDVVGRDRRTGPNFRELGRPVPYLTPDARFDQQLDDLRASIVGNCGLADRTTEPVRTLVVVRTYPDRHLMGAEPHVAAVGAPGPNGCHDDSSAPPQAPLRTGVVAESGRLRYLGKNLVR